MRNTVRFCLLAGCREPVQNLSDNLLRDFEDKWWKICREVGLNFDH